MKLWITLLLCAASAAQAQTIWRCGPDGRSYAEAPCRDGRALELADARPAADRLDAQDMARRETALAAQLLRERLERESQAAAGPAGIHGLRPAPAAAGIKPKAKSQATNKRRLEDDGIWRAIAPSSRRAKG